MPEIHKKAFHNAGEDEDLGGGPILTPVKSVKIFPDYFRGPSRGKSSA